MEIWKAPFFSQTVPPDFSGSERLDKYICSLPGAFNRSHLKSGIKEILVNSKAAKLSSKVRSGDKIQIRWEDSVPDNIEPEDIPLNVVYEDSDVCVVNKAQGMVTHPAAGNWSGTLVNALLARWKRQALPNDRRENESAADKKNAACAKSGGFSFLQNSASAPSLRPGIVHRLDKDTSGIIITAKNRAAEEWLQEQFKARRLCKEYILIARGVPPKKDGVIDTYIARDPSDRKKFKAEESSGRGKRAVSLYHLVSVYGGYSLVRVRLMTGRTHQIRVHMKFLGCPILGDSLYSKKDPLFPNESLALHSRLLKIRLPQKEQYAAFKARVPERFKRVIKILKEKYPRSYSSKGIRFSESARKQKGAAFDE